MKKRFLSTILKKITLCCVLLSLAATVAMLGLNIGLSAAYAAENGELHYEIDPVPADTAEITVPNGATTIKPGGNVRLGVILTPYYCNVQTVVYIITVGGEFASVDGDGRLSVSPDAPIGGIIKIVADAEGTMSEEYTFTVVKIPMESLTISAGEQMVINQGETLQLGFDVFPVNASNVDKITFSVIEGSSYATVDNQGKITVNDSVGISNAKIKVQAECADDSVISNVLEFSIYVVAKSVILTASTLNPVSSATTGETVTLTATKTDPHATGTPMISIISGAEFVDSFIDGNLTVKAGITAQNPTITVKATCDDKTDVIVLHIYIPAASVNISSGGQTVIAQNGQLQLSYDVLPVNATAKPTFTIISGSHYAEVDANGLIIVNSSLGVPDANITIRATVDGKTAELSFALYVPVTSVELSADNYSPKSYATSAESVTLSADVNAGATANRSVSYIIESGGEYVESINGNVLKIKSGVAATGKSIKLRASVTDAGGTTISSTITLIIYIPVENLTFDTAEVTEIDRGQTKQFTTNYNSNNVATTKSWTYVGSVITNANGNVISSIGGRTIIVSVDSTSNSVSVSQFAPAGTRVIVTYKASEEGGKTFTHTFVVKALTESNFTLQYYDFSSDKIYSGGTDSGGRELNLSAPQLATGCFIDVWPRYNGEDAFNYGVSYSVSGSSNATYGILNDKFFMVAPNSNASGKNNFINYTLTITDGNVSYTVSTSASNAGVNGKPKPISIFKAISGTPVLNTTTIYNSSTQLSVSSMDSNATTNISDLQFYKKGGDGTISVQGLLSLSSVSSSTPPIIYLTYNQPYNNTTILYRSNDITLSYKTITLNTQSGSGGTASVLAVNGFSKNITIPTRSGYAFGGYYTSTGGSGTQYYTQSGAVVSSSIFTASSPSTLYAKWVKTTYTETRTNNLTNVNATSRDETISPGFDVAALKALGYTKVTISVSYALKAESILPNGQRLQIANYGKTSELARKDTSQGTSWGNHSLSVTVSLDSLNSSSGQFMLLWSKTSWAEVSVGTRTVTITAVK